ncbi:Delta-aminolevulinic acid dehydratase [Mycena sanguinolenta]|uniref:Delta-aminolevulinic acid dehydratase n=1 Tax=Mycena sanguinolenta TaxID=230812 RepID=A0A8H7DJ81_9AGAR|nr:Delta-aminolevulinic acid dehydratase [Mycena sanguinolenta]
MDISSILQGGYQHPLSRQWQAQRQLTKEMLIQLIPTLPGQSRWGVNKLESFLGPLVKKGLKSVILFGVPMKCEKVRVPFLGANLYANCVRRITVARPQTTNRAPSSKPLKKSARSSRTCISRATSVSANTPTTATAGVLHSDGTINTEPSVKRIAEVALSYAKAGAHCVAPSDMMDGRIKSIKRALIDNGFGNKCTLMSYSAKFASSLYGPFRDAAGSAPSFGNRKCYQLPPAGRGLARRAIQRDVAEGADIIMVKPAMPYLDILADAAQLAPDHPLACYQVSGEFAMVHAGAAAGVYDLRTMAFESVDGMLRAGATLILTYFTPDFLDWLDN